MVVTPPAAAERDPAVAEANGAAGAEGEGAAEGEASAPAEAPLAPPPPKYTFLWSMLANPMIYGLPSFSLV